MAAPIRLLIADDSDSVRAVICKLLGLETRIAVTGQARDYCELVAMLQESVHDVVLMDVHMPGEGELDPSLVKDHCHRVCLLAMSVWNDEETKALAERFGARKLLDKSSLGTTLVPTIEDCMKEKSRVHQV